MDATTNPPGQPPYWDPTPIVRMPPEQAQAVVALEGERIGQEKSDG